MGICQSPPQFINSVDRSWVCLRAQGAVQQLVQRMCAPLSAAFVSYHPSNVCSVISSHSLAWLVGWLEIYSPLCEWCNFAYTRVVDWLAGSLVLASELLMCTLSTVAAEYIQSHLKTGCFDTLRVGVGCGSHPLAVTSCRSRGGVGV